MSSLGSGPVLTRPAPLSMTPPPAEKPREMPAPKPVAVGPAIPSAIPNTPSSPTPTPAPAAADSLADVVAALEADERPSSASPRPRSPTQQRFRQSNTGIGRLASNSSRRPQAAAPVEPPSSSYQAAPARQTRRGSTEVTDYDLETDVKDDWKNSLAVEDEQLVEWAGTGEETQNTDEYGRKR
jgi:hypothetical protein